MSKKEQSEAQSEAVKHLRETLRPGDRVYTILRHVSRGGRSRSISLVIVREGQIDDITYWAQAALNYRGSKQDSGMIVGGCGMDMGWHTVCNLSRVLFPTGFGTEGQLSFGRKIRPQT